MDEDCVFPEEYDTVGCTSGERWWPINDYYSEGEYQEEMNTLEHELLTGDVE